MADQLKFPSGHSYLRSFDSMGVASPDEVLGLSSDGRPSKALLLGGGADFGLEVTYIHQGDPRGLAHAVSCGQEFLAEDPFIMYLGDNLFQEGVEPLLDLYHTNRPDAAIAVTPVAEPRHYGVVELADGHIVSIEEKPTNPRSNLAVVGTYLFSPSIHGIIADLEPSARGELEITDALRMLQRAGQHIAVHQLRGWWKDAGRPADLLFANDEILKMMPRGAFARFGRTDASVRIDGPVGIGEGSVVGEGARLDGPSVLGRDVRVGEGAVVGPFSAVGDSCRVEGATLERTIVMDGAQISGPVRIVNSVIGRNCRVTARQLVREPVSLIIGDSALVEL
jgi:glucose-1-phosphate thymidylyltransferase